MTSETKPTIWIYLGVALVSMAALANEIILTRIFSVTLWYHFAFSVISLALLGSGAAGVWLHLSTKRLAKMNVGRVLVTAATGLSVALFVAFWIYLQIPLTMGSLRGTLGGQQIAFLALAYLVLTIPYLFVGSVMALALRQYQGVAGRIYFADLVGAGLGCVVSVLALQTFGGVTAILAIAAIAALGAVSFALAQSGNKDIHAVLRLVAPLAVLLVFDYTAKLCAMCTY